MSYYFKNSYQPEITCIANTISNIDYLCESSTDKKFINTFLTFSLYTIRKKEGT